MWSLCRFKYIYNYINFFQTYVQDWIQKESLQIFNALVYNNGHFYVCGDCTMAEDVFQTLKQLVKNHGHLSSQETESYMINLRVHNQIEHNPSF